MLVLRTCQQVTLQEKRIFADVIKSMILLLPWVRQVGLMSSQGTFISEIRREEDQSLRGLKMLLCWL